MANESAPRVAVTNYMALFGGPDGRACQTAYLPNINSCDNEYGFRYLVERYWWQYQIPLKRSLSRKIRPLSKALYVALANWDIDSLLQIGVLPERSAVVFSSSKGDVFWLQDDWQRFWSGRKLRAQMDRLGWTCDDPAYLLCKWLGAGNSQCPVAACASGAHAIARGAQMIRWGQADWVLCGAEERAQTPLVTAGYRQIGALSKSGIMHPFDHRRDGFVPSEGIGALILENEEHARARGAKIHGYVTGWDMGADATSMTAMCPSGDSIARAIERALKRAGNPQIDYINAHGTATLLNDEIESRGIKSVFGKSVPVSSTKPLTGHLLGAAGAVEAVICLQALREQWAPPTLNLEEPDDACDLDYIPITSESCGRDLPLKTVMSLNYGFGGHIGVLIFEAAP